MWKLIANANAPDRESYTEGMELPGGVLIRNTTFVGIQRGFSIFVATNCSESMIFMEGYKLMPDTSDGGRPMFKLEKV